MHVSAHWTALQMLFLGGKVVIAPPGPLDGDAVWRVVANEGVNILVIVGDAMARPLADALEADPSGHDTVSLFVIASGGAVLSPSTKERLATLLPNVIVIDGLGSSESGVIGQKSETGRAADGPPRFALNDETLVLDGELRPVEPGSATVGRLARRGHIPLGYYNSPEKTAETFVEVDGVRWVLTGDMAIVEPDGTIVLLGRASVCINTGGEKVFAEEVEVAVKAHPDVEDAVIVGVADERWGERVVALVASRGGVRLSDIQETCRSRVAGYKVPRDLVVVDKVLRLPTGKTDYQWAREEARRRLGVTEGRRVPT